MKRAFTTMKKKMKVHKDKTRTIGRRRESHMEAVKYETHESCFNHSK